ncbi:addiction module antidote protein [Aquirufa antheringensis]
METSKFDIADYLDSNEMVTEYLNAVLAEGNESDFIVTIGNIAKSIGMSKIANETGLSRPSLYKALSDGSKPQVETIIKVLHSIGYRMQIHPNNEVGDSNRIDRAQYNKEIDAAVARMDAGDFISHKDALDELS